MKRSIFLCLTAALVFPALASAQNVEDYMKAQAYFKNEFFVAKHGPEARAKAVAEMASRTFEKVDPETATLLINALKTELGQSNELNISNTVLEAITDGLKKITSANVIKKLIPVAQGSTGEPWRVRFYMIHAFAAYPGEEVTDALIKLASSDPYQAVRVAALDGLAARADKKAMEPLIKILKDDRLLWEVKISAVKALGAMNDPHIVRTLVSVLSKTRADEGRLRDEIFDALKKITGVDPVVDPKGLDAWLADKEKIENSDPNVKPGADDELKFDTTTFTVRKPIDPVNFYGLKSTSTRVVFILDITGSMLEPGSEPPKQDRKDPPEETILNDILSGSGGKAPAKLMVPVNNPLKDAAKQVKDKNDKRVVRTKIDAAKKELIDTIYHLDPRVYFTVIFYSSSHNMWQQKLVPATWENKIDAMKTVEKQSAYGPTNTWDALEKAFQILPATDTKPNPNDLFLDKRTEVAVSMGGADTIYLLTDGEPNVGRIFQKPQFIEELRKINKLRKVTIHTIAVGDNVVGGTNVKRGGPLGSTGVDPAFLQQVATENGGTSVHIHR